MVYENNRDILGTTYDELKKQQENALYCNLDKKYEKNANKNLMKLPRHYEPKGLIWSVNEFREEANNPISSFQSNQYKNTSKKKSDKNALAE